MELETLYAGLPPEGLPETSVVIFAGVVPVGWAFTSSTMSYLLLVEFNKK